MIKQSRTAAALIICSAMSVSALSGCASKQDKAMTSRTRLSADDTSFAAGAGRAPTAATSYSFAKILVSQGRDRDALYVLARVLREHPEFVPAYNEMASVYVRADRLEDAVAVIESGLKHAPNDPVLHNNLGMCYLLDGDHAHALEAFTQAAEYMPTNPTFRSNRAAALALSGRTAEAESEYRTVLGKTATRQNLTILDRARANKGDDKSLDADAAVAPAVDAADAPAVDAAPTEASTPTGDAGAQVEIDAASEIVAPHAAEVEIDTLDGTDVETNVDATEDVEVVEDADLSADAGFNVETELTGEDLDIAVDDGPCPDLDDADLEVEPS